MSQELEYDRSLVGKEYRTGPYEVSTQLVRDFCSSIGETNPIYVDEKAARTAGHDSVLAPPTLCTIFIREVTVPDIKLRFGHPPRPYGTRVHAGQKVTPLAPIRAGDSLMASSYLKDVYPKTGRSGTMVFIVWETTFTNQKGEQVAAVQESFAARE